VSEFLRNAESILEAAGSVLDSGETPTDMAILVGESGAIRLVAGSDWPLDSLESYHGARMAYRVKETGGRVQVEGRCGGAACVLTADSPATTARHLLHCFGVALPPPGPGLVPFQG